MKSILIRDLNNATLAALKILAAYHNRSLQGELHAILEEAARKAPNTETTGKLELVTVRTGRSGTWHRDEMYDDEGR